MWVVKKIRRALEFWWFQKTFSKKFIFYTTEDPQELDETFRLRYKVYCEEHEFLDKAGYPDGRETDEYDNHSIHFVLRDSSGEIAATVRLITNSELQFPVEKHFDFDIKVAIENRDHLAEISRLIVSRKYRRHHLLLALIKGIYVYVKEHKITHVYSVLDDRLFPTLLKIGFPYKRIGQPSTYQGLTSPHLLVVAEMEEVLHSVNPSLYQYLKRGVLETNNNGKYPGYSIH